MLGFFCTLRIKRSWYSQMLLRFKFAHAPYLIDPALYSACRFQFEPVPFLIALVPAAFSLHLNFRSNTLALKRPMLAHSVRIQNRIIASPRVLSSLGCCHDTMQTIFFSPSTIRDDHIAPVRDLRLSVTYHDAFESTMQGIIVCTIRIVAIKK